MQSSTSSMTQPEAILEWLHKEMGYQPQGPYHHDAALPSIESLRKLCRGNMVPVFNFLLKRVKSEKTVEKVRRNILVHGSGGGGSGKGEEVDEGRSGRGGKLRKDKDGGRAKVLPEKAESSTDNSKEVALKEREAAEREVRRLRMAVQRLRSELKAKMIEASREEAERKRLLDERGNYRHKEVMLEAYSQQCNEAALIFAEYQKRLQHFVSQAREAHTSSGVDKGTDSITNWDRDSVYSTMKANRSSGDVILIETGQERDIRMGCDLLAAHLMERICSSFPAYQGAGIHPDPEVEAAKIGFEIDDDLPQDVKNLIVDSLRNPPLLLHAITAYTLRMKALIHKETEKIDMKADAELLRYKFDNNRVVDAVSPNVGASLQYQMYVSGKVGLDTSTSGTHHQLFERQKAYVQQFLDTEDALNKAAEAREISQNLIKHLHGSNNTVSVPAASSSQNLGSLRLFELDVLSKEREAAGLRASVNKLTAEVQRLKKLCEEGKEAEEALRKKWKKIDEFDARRIELESIYTSLLRANERAATFWSQQPLVAREFASRTIIPSCSAVMEIATGAKDLVEKEVTAFSQSPNDSLYMLPSTPQALLESMGVSVFAGPEAVAAAEKSAALLTARAGARDPSAIPSICRVPAALQFHTGLEGSDAGFASVLSSLEFCLKLRGSEASVLEDLSKAISLVHIQRDLLRSGHGLLNHADRVQKEYDRMTNYCLTLAAEQEKVVMDKWVPELKNAFAAAQTCLEDCKRVKGLIYEWWEQPAATIVDWVTVDGENVGAWLNSVKQRQVAFYDKKLL